MTRTVHRIPLGLALIKCRGSNCQGLAPTEGASRPDANLLPSPPRLDRFEKTNEMLLNFNNLSSVRLQQMSERFVHHTRTLVDMKRDLDSIFRRIRWPLPQSSSGPTACLTRTPFPNHYSPCPTSGPFCLTNSTRSAPPL